MHGKTFYFTQVLPKRIVGSEKMPRSKVKITVLKRVDPSVIFDGDVPNVPGTDRKFTVCTAFEDDQEFIVEENLRMPDGFCESAWRAINHNVRALGFGGSFPFHDERSVSVSCCTDGLRPVIFKIERI